MKVKMHHLVIYLERCQAHSDDHQCYCCCYTAMCANCGFLVSYLISAVPNQHPLLFCLLSIQLEPCGMPCIQPFSWKRDEPRLCRGWEVSMLRLYPTRRVGWPQLQEGRRKKQEAEVRPCTVWHATPTGKHILLLSYVH